MNLVRSRAVRFYTVRNGDIDSGFDSSTIVHTSERIVDSSSRTDYVSATECDDDAGREHGRWERRNDGPHLFSFLYRSALCRAMIIRMRYTAIFESQPYGGYHAFCPMLVGCHSEGDTLDDAITPRCKA
jgi:hypothetical protein